MEGGQRIIRIVKRKKKSHRIIFLSCIVIFSLAFFHSIKNQRRKTTIPKELISNLQIVPKVCPPRDKSAHKPQCPKAICVPIDRQAGLGHRLTNVLTGYILSLALNLPLAGPELEHVGGHHGGYPGANTLFHLDEGDEIVQCPTKNIPPGYDAPENWTLHMLNSEEHTLDSFSFGSEDITLHINSLPYGNSNLAFTFAENDGCAAIEELRKIVANAGCNTLFISGQFFSRTYLPAHEFLRSIYRGDDPEVSNALLTHYLYRDDTFNVALHIRDGGDIKKYMSEIRKLYFMNIISTVLDELAQTNIPVTIYVFSENPERHVILLREVAAKSEVEEVEVIGQDGDLSAIETFLHFMKADVFVGSDSSFSWMVNYIAGGSKKPIVVATSNDHGDYSKNYSPGNLIGMLDGTIAPTGQISAAAKKWKRSRLESH